MGSKNKYTTEDRIVAYALYKNLKAGETGIGLFEPKKIAQICGHSVASFKMKVDQFKGIVGCRKRHYKEGAFGPGLNEWADDDVQVHEDYKATSLLDLTYIGNRILMEKLQIWNDL